MPETQPAQAGTWACAQFFAALIAWTVLGSSIFASGAPGWVRLAAPGLVFALSAVSMAVIAGCSVRPNVV